MIPEEIEKYCQEHSSPESPALAALKRETHLTQVYPRMLSGPMQGLLLKFISSMLNPSKILEIGTFTGYSAICLASGSPCLVHTIEVNPELESLIRRHIKNAGLEKKVILHIGDALKVIPELDEIWDLVFIDADKPNYLNYYKTVLPRLKPGGWIIADNTLWNGKVLKPGRTDKDTAGIIEFNDFIQNDTSVENLLLPFRDGLMLIRKL